MNFKCILWILLLFINHVVGEFLQMSFSSVDMSRVIRSISAITITACHMECGKDPACHDIAMTERTPDNQLPTCYLLKEDNGHYDEGGNVMTTIQAIGSGVRVDGQWSCWKSISACTVSCGGGVLNQTRDCDSPRPAEGGDNCTGPAERTIKCNEQNCTVNGQWGNWKNISSCNVPCGGGVLKQTRDCNSPRPANGGDDCTGPAEREIKCNEQNCQVVNVALRKKATQSLTNDAIYEASKAVDGDILSNAYTNLVSEPWWEVDLGNIKLIKEIRLTAYSSSRNNKGLLVETRTKNAESWRACFNVGDVTKLVTKFPCHDKTTKARFVRIRSTEKCHLYFNEVEIFGY